MPRKYIVKTRYDAPKEFDDSSDAATYITEDENYIDELEVDVDEFIDEAYGHIDIGGSEYWASQILKNLDEYVYNEMEQEEKRNCAEGNTDYVSERLDAMCDGDEEWFEGGVKVTSIDQDEDDDNEDPVFDQEFGSVFEYIM